MGATATFAPRPMQAPTGWAVVPESWSLSEMVAHGVAEGHLTLAEAQSPNLTIWLHGMEVPRANWHRVRPKPGVQILVRVRPMGGEGSGKKSPLRTILSLLVVVAVAWISGGGAAGLITGLFEAGSTSALILAGVASVALNALVNAIAPVPQPDQLGRSESYSLSGARNTATPYEACLIALGEHRVTGRLAARYFTKVFGDNIFLYMIVQWHVGRCEISDLKIGDTPIGDFADVTIAHRLNGESYASTLGAIVGNLVFEDPDIQIEMKQIDGWQRRTFPARAEALSFDIAFPGGLYMTDGGVKNRTVSFEVEYKKLTDVSWLPVPTTASVHMTAPGVLTFTTASMKPLRRMMVWDAYDAGIAPANYEMRLRRTTADTNSTKVVDEAFWVCMRAERAGDAITDDSICATALYIIANGQLNGVIDELNAIVKPIIPVWDGTDWDTEATTKNPAAQYRWIHTGPAIGLARRLATTRFEAGVLEDWHDYTVAKGLTCSAVIDYAASVDEVAQMVASCGYATAAWVGADRTAIIDDTQVATQLFTAETVRNFRGRIVFLDPVHALRVSFLNAAAGFKADEVIVFADGYDETNATLYERAEAPGKTNAVEAWRTGKRIMARGQIRRIGYEFEIDAESLVSRFGRRALVEHFALKEEAQSARVDEVLMSGPDIAGVRIDEAVTMEHGVLYGLKLRRSDDGALPPVFDIINPAGPGAPVTTTILMFDGAVLPALAPEIEDLVVWGERTTMVEDLSIILLSPGDDDYTAAVVAVPYDEALFAHDAVIPVLPPSILQAGTAGRQSVGAGTQSSDLNPTPSPIAVQERQAQLIVEGDLLQLQIDQALGARLLAGDGTQLIAGDGTYLRAG